MKYLPFLLLFVGGAFLTLGDIFFKRWALESHNWLYAVAIALYIVGLNFFGATLRESNLAIASTILVTCNTLILVVVSYFLFKEKFTTLQLVGIALGVVSLVLLHAE